jgi:hypothetical protein
MDPILTIKMQALLVAVDVLENIVIAKNKGLPTSVNITESVLASIDEIVAEMEGMLIKNETSS